MSPIIAHDNPIKIRYVELDPKTAPLLHDCLEAADHVGDKRGPLFRPDDFSTHTTRVTATTKAHENGADLRELQEWLGHSSPATTGLYIRRRYKPEKPPTFKTDF